MLALQSVIMLGLAKLSAASGNAAFKRVQCDICVLGCPAQKWPAHMQVDATQTGSTQQCAPQRCDLLVGVVPLPASSTAVEAAYAAAAPEQDENAGSWMSAHGAKPARTLSPATLGDLHPPLFHQQLPSQSARAQPPRQVPLRASRPPYKAPPQLLGVEVTHAVGVIGEKLIDTSDIAPQQAGARTPAVRIELLSGKACNSRAQDALERKLLIGTELFDEQKHAVPAAVDATACDADPPMQQCACELDSHAPFLPPGTLLRAYGPTPQPAAKRGKKRKASTAQPGSAGTRRTRGTAAQAAASPLEAPSALRGLDLLVVDAASVRDMGARVADSVVRAARCERGHATVHYLLSAQSHATCMPRHISDEVAHKCRQLTSGEGAVEIAQLLVAISWGAAELATRGEARSEASSSAQSAAAGSGGAAQWRWSIHQLPDKGDEAEGDGAGPSK